VALILFEPSVSKPDIAKASYAKFSKYAKASMRIGLKIAKTQSGQLNQNCPLKSQSQLFS
jgi:hypothetical protein